MTNHRPVSELWTNQGQAWGPLQVQLTSADPGERALAGQLGPRLPAILYPLSGGGDNELLIDPRVQG